MVEEVVAQELPEAFCRHLENPDGCSDHCGAASCAFRPAY